MNASSSSVPITVTTALSASSSTEDGSTLSVTPVDSVSSSEIVTVVPVTVRPVTVPDTENVSSPSARPSSLGFSVNVAVSAVLPAAIVSVRSATVA